MIETEIELLGVDGLIIGALRVQFGIRIPESRKEPPVIRVCRIL